MNNRHGNSCIRASDAQKLGVDILTDDYFVLSQCTRLTDRQTDRHNSYSKTVRCNTCSRTVETNET